MSSTWSVRSGSRRPRCYAALHRLVYAAQPRTMAEVRGGVASTIGAYAIDQGRLRRGAAPLSRRSVRRGARAFARADPALRDPTTQFYIAYSFMRQGWGRVYRDDTLYAQALEALGRADGAWRPNGYVRVDDAGLTLRTSDELQGRARARADARRPPTSIPARAAEPAVSGPRLDVSTPARGTAPVALDDPAAVREAFVLPLLLLTVALLGGFRVGATGGALAFVPPPLMALVLAVLLVAALYRSGTLVVERLLGPDRRALANAGGSLSWRRSSRGGAGVQHADARGRTAARSRSILPSSCCSATRWPPSPIASRAARKPAASSSAPRSSSSTWCSRRSTRPEPGLTKRVVLALLEGVSLGALAYQAPGPATGYVAFVAVAALPRRRSRCLPRRPAPGVPPSPRRWCSRTMAARWRTDEPPAHDLDDRVISPSTPQPARRCMSASSLTVQTCTEQARTVRVADEARRDDAGRPRLLGDLERP